MLGISVAWVALWWVSRIMEYAPHASLWYPPAALSYVVFRQYGYQGIPAIVLAVVAVTLVSANLDQQALPNHLVLLTGLLYACAHAAPYYLAARIMAKQRPANTGRAAPRVAIAFLIISSLASLLAAVLGAMSLVLAGVVGENEALAIVLPWWIGDFAAILALGPAGVFWLNRVAIQRQTSRQIPRDQYYYQADQSGHRS